MNYRTNSGTLQTFKVDPKNELTNYLGMAQSYDAKGNLTNCPGPNSGPSCFPHFRRYDDENGLISVWTPSTRYLKYDYSDGGLGRPRVADVST